MKTSSISTRFQGMHRLLAAPLVLCFMTSTTSQARPLPARAERELREGRAARRREAPSTDRGWASTLLSTSLDQGNDFALKLRWKEAEPLFRQAWALKRS